MRLLLEMFYIGHQWDLVVLFQKKFIQFLHIRGILSDGIRNVAQRVRSIAGLTLASAHAERQFCSNPMTKENLTTKET
jgi:hypothetical protein